MGLLNEVVLTFYHLSTQLTLVGFRVKVSKCKLWCRNPTLAKCGGEAQHLEKVGIGVVTTVAFGLRLRQGG